MTKNKYELHPATREDVLNVSTRLRAPDVAEAYAMWGSDINISAALYQSFVVSRDTTWAGYINGTPEVIFGAKPETILSGVARPWMMGTPVIEDHAMRFLRVSRRIADLWSQSFPYLENWVHADNEKAIRWLQWLGFTLYYPEPFGPEDELFHRFEMRS